MAGKRRARLPWGRAYYLDPRRGQSGRWQARYLDAAGVLRTAPETFGTRTEVRDWLLANRARLLGEGPGPAGTPETFDTYADAWLAGRRVKPTTRAEYRRLIDAHLSPAWGSSRLDRITPARVRAWYAGLSPDAPTQRARAYGLLRTILGTAVRDDLILANPCRVEGGGTVARHSTTKPATLAELAAIREAMPDRLRLAVDLSAWCALRFGELTELRRGDVDAKAGTVTVARGVTRVTGQARVVGDPKTAAGRRVVAIPPHVLPAVREHLAAHVSASRSALLFPSGLDPARHLAPSALYRWWYPAREAAGRPDLRWHDLRHTGATLAAVAGATLADLQARLGHSTVSAAMRYQHAAAGRDQVIAAALSDLATAADVVPISRGKGQA